MDGETWGQSLVGAFTTGSKFYYDYSYKLATGLRNDDFHLIVYLYDVDTYEILQVIKHEF